MSGITVLRDKLRKYIIRTGKALGSESGITLIELSIALAVTVIIGSGVFVAASGDHGRRSLYNACVSFRNDIRYAQRMAVITGDKYRIIVNVGMNRYYMFRFVNIKYVTEKIVDMPEGVKISDTSNLYEVTYNPWGTPDQAGTIRVDGSGYYQKITVIPSSGRAELTESGKLVK